MRASVKCDASRTSRSRNTHPSLRPTNTTFWDVVILLKEKLMARAKQTSKRHKNNTTFHTRNVYLATPENLWCCINRPSYMYKKRGRRHLEKEVTRLTLCKNSVKVHWPIFI